MTMTNNQSAHPALPPGTEAIPSVTCRDVVMGRGPGIQNHRGNVTYRRLVSLNKELYVTSPKYHKLKIAKAVVAAVRGSGGRFVQAERGSEGPYFDVGDRRAWHKTSQALREGHAEVAARLAEGPAGRDRIVGYKRVISKRAFFAYARRMMESLGRPAVGGTGASAARRQNHGAMWPLSSLPQSHDKRPDKPVPQLVASRRVSFGGNDSIQPSPGMVCGWNFQGSKDFIQPSSLNLSLAGGGAGSHEPSPRASKKNCADLLRPPSKFPGSSKYFIPDLLEDPVPGVGSPDDDSVLPVRNFCRVDFEITPQEEKNLDQQSFHDDFGMTPEEERTLVEQLDQVVDDVDDVIRRTWAA